MKINNTAVTAFLDGKYIPLAPKIKLAIAVVITLLPLVFFYFIFFEPNRTKISGLESQKTSLTQEIKTVEARVADLAKFEKELEEATAAFKETSALLPQDKEIPKLLKDISALGRSAGLDFLTFRPKAEVPKDFYADVPVDIIISGSYFSVANFFAAVANLPRIVNITNVAFSDIKSVNNRMMTKVTCLATTFRFLDKKEIKDDKKVAPKK